MTDDSDMGKTIGTRLPSNTNDRFKDYADRNELTNSEALRRLVREGLDVVEKREESETDAEQPPGVDTASGSETGGFISRILSSAVAAFAAGALILTGLGQTELAVPLVALTILFALPVFLRSTINMDLVPDFSDIDFDVRKRTGDVVEAPMAVIRSVLVVGIAIGAFFYVNLSGSTESAGWALLGVMATIYGVTLYMAREKRKKGGNEDFLTEFGEKNLQSFRQVFWGLVAVLVAVIAGVRVIATIGSFVVLWGMLQIGVSVLRVVVATFRNTDETEAEESATEAAKRW